MAQRITKYANPDDETLAAEIADEAERKRRANAWKELDTLRAENERQDKIIATLTTDLNASVDRIYQLSLDIDALRAENKRLKAELVEADRKVREYRPNVDAALAENERLRADLLKATDHGEHWYRRWTERSALLNTQQRLTQDALWEIERLRAVVDAARDWCVVSGHNMPYWKDCTADPPESCTWVILRDAIEALDRHKRA